MLKNLSVLFLVVAGVCQSEEDFFSVIDVDASAFESQRTRAIDYRGYIQWVSKYGVDTPDSRYLFERDSAGMSQLQTNAFVELRGQLSESLQWQISGKLEVDAYQWQEGEAQWKLHRERLRLKDAYLDATFDNGVWLRLGHQVLAWGQSEGLAITDILSPVDSRAPGQAELQDLREQIPAAMLSLPVAGGKLSTVVTWRAGHNRYAEDDEEFYPYIALKTAQIATEYVTPENRYESAIQWERHFNGGDMTLIAGDVNANDYAVKRLLPTKVTLVQPRVTVVGGAANRVWGSWLFRAELAHYWNQPVQLDARSPWVKQKQWRGMAGIEYSGIDDVTFSYEINSIHVPESAELHVAEDDYRAPRWQTGHVLRVMQTALNSRFTQQLWAIAVASDAMHLYRWDIAYELSDSWEIGLAATAYTNNNHASALYPFRKNDTLNASVSYRF